MEVLRAHLNGCARCARHDADVRRALLLLKNVPPISVSAGFQDRLRERIAREGAAGTPATVRMARRVPLKWVATAAAVVAVAGVASWTGASRSPENAPHRLPAVIASVPPVSMDASDDSAPAYLASMSTGVPMWPALMLAEEGPLRFAATELQNAAWDASKPNE